MIQNVQHNNNETQEWMSVISSICSKYDWYGFQVSLREVHSIQSFIDKFMFALPGSVDCLILLTESKASDNVLADGFSGLLSGSDVYLRIGEMRLKSILKLMSSGKEFVEHFILCVFYAPKKYSGKLKSYTQDFKQHLTESMVSWETVETWLTFEKTHLIYDVSYEKRLTRSPCEGMWFPTLQNEVYFFNDLGERKEVNHTLITGTKGCGKTRFEQTWLIHALAKGERVVVIDTTGAYQQFSKVFGGKGFEITSCPFNPFSVFDGKHIDLLVDLISLIIRTEGNLDELEKQALKNAVKSVWKEKQRQGSIKDLLERFSGVDVISKRLKFELAYFSEKTFSMHHAHALAAQLHDAPFIVFDVSGLQCMKRLQVLSSYLVMMYILMCNECQAKPVAHLVIDDASLWTASKMNVAAIQFLQASFSLAAEQGMSFNIVLEISSGWRDTMLGKFLERQSQQEVCFKQPLDACPMGILKNMNHKSQMLSMSRFETEGVSECALLFKERVSFHAFWIDPYLYALLFEDWSQYSVIQTLCEDGLMLEEAIYQVMNTAHELTVMGE